MIEELRELWRYRELLLVMTQRELRVRYKNSALGFLWSFVNPLVTTLVMTLVFGKMLGNGVVNFSAYVLAAYLPFTFFQFAVLDSAQSILTALPVIRKVYFPREILVLASVLGNFVHLAIGFVVFFLFLFFWVYARSGFQDSPFQATTWMLPFLMLISMGYALGVGLLVAALNTFYEDVKYVSNVVTYLLFYLCPVIYFHETVANALRGDPWLFRLYMADPMAVLSIAYRKALLPGVPVKIGTDLFARPSPMPWPWIGYVAVASVATLVFGYAVFNRLKWRFVERP